MHRTEGENNVGNLHSESVPYTTLTPQLMNAIQEEISNVIEQAGITLLTQATDTNDQLYDAISSLVGAKSNYYTDSGSANNYVLTKAGTGAPTSYFDGLTVQFVPANTNTGASQINVNGLGNKDIVRTDETPLAASSLIYGRSLLATCVFDQSADNFKLLRAEATELAVGPVLLATDALTAALSTANRVVTPANLGSLDATTSQRGIIETATGAETYALTADNKAVTPLSLANLLSTDASASTGALRDGNGRLKVQAGNSSLNAPNIGQFILSTVSGYFRIPCMAGATFANFYVQWDTVALPNNATTPFSWPITFPNGFFGASITRSSNFDSYNEESGVAYFSPTTSGLTLSSQMATNAFVLGIGW